MRKIISKYKLFKENFIENEEDPEYSSFSYPSYLDKLKVDLDLWHSAFYHESVTYMRLYFLYKQIKSKLKKIFIKEVVVEKVVYRYPPPELMINCPCSSKNNIRYWKHHLN